VLADDGQDARVKSLGTSCYVVAIGGQPRGGGRSRPAAFRRPNLGARPRALTLGSPAVLCDSWQVSLTTNILPTPTATCCGVARRSSVAPASRRPGARPSTAEWAGSSSVGITNGHLPARLWEPGGLRRGRRVVYLARRPSMSGRPRRAAPEVNLSGSHVPDSTWRASARPDARQSLAAGGPITGLRGWAFFFPPATWPEDSGRGINGFALSSVLRRSVQTPNRGEVRDPGRCHRPVSRVTFRTDVKSGWEAARTRPGRRFADWPRLNVFRAPEPGQDG